MANWNGILKILEINHYSENNELLWSDKNIKNLLHFDGEEFILSNIFQLGFSTSKTTSGTPEVPANYYLGLDNRSSPNASDIMSNISGEPTGGGYARQTANSTSGFTVGLGTNGHNRAITGTLIFSATGGGWGPVKNIFMSNKIDGTGYLISTAALTSSRTLTSGQSLTLRVAMSLQDSS